MASRAAVPTLLALAVSLPAFAQTPAKPRKPLIWELGVSLSAAIVYRMDSMQAELHKEGADMLEHARRTATRLGTALPADEALRGPEVDTMAALQYLQNPRQHPLALYLAEHDGRTSAALFELGALSHLAMIQSKPSSEVAKDLAARLESAATGAELPRSTWGGLVDSLRTGTSANAVKEAMAAMTVAVAAECKK